jgi:hypothetical protein
VGRGSGKIELTDGHAAEKENGRQNDHGDQNITFNSAVRFLFHKTRYGLSKPPAM